MIEKMRYVKIMGKVEDVDRVIEKYISKYDIELINTTKELSESSGIYSFNVNNPYNSQLRKAEKLATQLHIEPIYTDMPDEKEANKTIDKAYINSLKVDSKDKEALDRIEECERFLKVFEPFAEIDGSIEDILTIKFIKYRYGKMPLGSYKQFQTFLYTNKNMLFVESKKDANFIYGLCFITDNFEDEADSLLATYHFERAFIPYELCGEKLTGKMSSIYANATKQLQEMKAIQKEIDDLKLDTIEISKDQLAKAFGKIKTLQYYFDTRKLAAKTQNKFFIFVGWIPLEQSWELSREVETDGEVIVKFDEGLDAKTTEPPTKLKNLALFRPFEMFVTMYGLPSYNESDPTMLVAILYTLFFGAMFGDIGQGAVLALSGFLLYKIKNFKLGLIITIIGISSMFFGVMYGSIFGLENVIDGIWIKPLDSINYILFAAITGGIIIIFFTMFINMLNSARQKNWGKLFFSANGIAGMTFYFSVLAIAIMVVQKNDAHIPSMIALAIIALLFVTFKEPLTLKVEGKKIEMHTNLFLYIFEMVIEIFETLLSYFANTVSFVRIGAFALSHAGIMGVVLALSETGHEKYNIIGLVLGNLIVICFEGLVVGIQALRLNFYEIFSRFYDGGGKAFVPYKKRVE